MQRHACRIDDDVAGLDPPFPLEDVSDILDGLIGCGEAVVIVAAHAPYQVQGGQHVHAVRKDVNVFFWAGNWKL